MMRLAMIFCCAGLAFGCSSGSSGSAGNGGSGGDADTPFTMATHDKAPFELVVVDENDAPLAGVRVSVEDPSVASGTSDAAMHRIHFRGVTRADGRLSAAVRLPLDRDTVDVVVNAAGRRGPFSDSELRTALGPTAPSARITVAPADLAGLRIALEPRN